MNIILKLCVFIEFDEVLVCWLNLQSKENRELTAICDELIAKVGCH